MVADTSLKHSHGSEAQFVETAGLSKPHIHKGDTERLARRNSGSVMKSTFVKNCVGRCRQSHSDDDYGECVVAMHVLPIKGTAQVTFKVVDGTEPTLSMPMLEANGNREAYSGEDAMSITAAPLTSDGDDCHMKVLVNNSNEFMYSHQAEEQFEPRTNWCRGQNPQHADAGRR